MLPCPCSEYLSNAFIIYNPPPRVPPGEHVTELNAGPGDRIRPAVGEDFSGHTEESGTTGSLGVWGRGASNSLVPSGGPRLHVAVGVRGSCLNHALAAPGCVPIFFFFWVKCFLSLDQRVLV